LRIRRCFSSCSWQSSASSQAKSRSPCSESLFYSGSALELGRSETSFGRAIARLSRRKVCAWSKYSFRPLSAALTHIASSSSTLEHRMKRESYPALPFLLHTIVSWGSGTMLEPLHNYVRVLSRNGGQPCR